MPIESVTPSSHLILCQPLLLLPSIPQSIRVFSNESALRMRWPKYWRFSFSISPSNGHPGLISFRMDWLEAWILSPKGFPVGSEGKVSACNAGDPGSIPGSGRSLGEGKGQPTPVHLPGKFHGWRSLVGYSPWGREESDRTEWIHFYFSLSPTGEGNCNPLQYSCLENLRDRGAR